MADKKTRGQSALGGKKKSKKSKGRKPHEIHVRRSANGGYIAKHDFKRPMGQAEIPDSEEHTLPTLDALKDHIGEHMGPEESAGGSGPSPMPGGMMGM